MDKMMHSAGQAAGQAARPAARPSAAARAAQSFSKAEAGMEYWRVDRVARYLDVSKKRVYQLVQEKRLQAIRLGPRQMRILRRSLDEYLRALLEAGS